MTTVPALRQALSDLPVNTTANFSNNPHMNKPITGQKRPYSALNNSENRVEDARIKHTRTGAVSAAGGELKKV